MKEVKLIFGFTGAAIGDCTTDSFMLSTPGNKGSPVICGTNKDQHGKNLLMKKTKFVLNLNFKI